MLRCRHTTSNTCRCICICRQYHVAVRVRGTGPYQYVAFSVMIAVDYLAYHGLAWKGQRYHHTAPKALAWGAWAWKTCLLRLVRELIAVVATRGESSKGVGH